MAVAVVGADRDDAHTGGEFAVERIALVGAAVVGDLHHVDGPEGGGGGHRALGLLPQVAEEDHPERSREEHGDARVVADERHSARLGGRRPQDVETVGAEAAREASECRDDLGSAVVESLDQAFSGPAVCGAHERAVDAAEDRLETPDVIEVVVGEHEEVDAVDFQAVETGQERLGVRAHVDEGREARAPNEHRITLADVARRELPVGRDGARTADRAPAEGTRDHRCAQEHPDARAEGHPWPPAPHPEGHPDQGEHEHGAGRRGEAVREIDGGQGQRGEVSGDGADPGRGQPREPRGDLRETGRHHGEHAHDETEHAHGCGRGLGEEVGGHRVGREPRREEEEDRLARELCGDRNRHGDGECGGNTLRDESRERAGEQEQPCRGEHREREAGTPAEPGVEREEHHDGEAERRDAGRRPAEGQCDEHDHGHGGRSEHARLGRDQHHEQQQHSR